MRGAGAAAGALELLAGPCVLESEDLALEVAQGLKERLAHLGGAVSVVFKGSFDKANRSSIDGYRGPGMERGLAILERVKKEHALPVVTDFHLPSQADEVASVADVLQVPAFLCRQTDMVSGGAEACRRRGGRLNVKKGQFVSPGEAANIVAKALPFLPRERVMLTERGHCFGYNNLVVDMASFQVMGGLGVTTVFDATHSVQLPGGLGKETGGKREQIGVLARAAAAAGADALFVEVHPRVHEARSDAATALPLDGVGPLVEGVLRVREAVR